MRGQETTPLRGESRRVARCIGALGTLAAAAAWTAGAVERVMPAEAAPPRAERVLDAASAATAEDGALQPVTTVTLPIATGAAHRQAPSAARRTGNGPQLASRVDDRARMAAGTSSAALAVALEALTLARRPRLRDALAARLVGHLEEAAPPDAATGSD